MRVMLLSYTQFSPTTQEQEGDGGELYPGV